MRLVVALALATFARPVLAQTCGDGAIDHATETCDDGNTSAGDGCAPDCTVEMGWYCVPALHASGVSNSGENLPDGAFDPHWTWSTDPAGTNPSPGFVGRHPAWADLPPGNWVTTEATFGGILTTEPATYWTQHVFMPAAFAGTLTFPVAVASDNEAEVFVNGVSYGSQAGFGAAVDIPVPSSAFVPATTSSPSGSSSTSPARRAGSSCTRAAAASSANARAAA